MPSPKLPTLTLHPQRHKRVAAGHPWIFSNELVTSDTSKNIAAGSLVHFAQHSGALLGIGTYNPHSLIAGRILTRHAVVDLDKDWVSHKLLSARHMRDRLIGVPYYRLIHAEADGLAGLVIDRFADILSVQINSAGMEQLWPHIRDAITTTLAPAGIVVRRDSPVRALEHAPLLEPEILGTIPADITVRQNGLLYCANLIGGQKTGWYYDQRDNHALVARQTANGKSVLDLFTHAGGFALLAAHQGASRVVGVDSSSTALDLAQKGASLNNLTNCSWVEADVFEDTQHRIASKEKFDIVIADPPPFVRSRKDLASGTRGYRKLAKQSATLVTEQGLLYIASCSYNMSLDDFRSAVADGLMDAKRTGRILYTTFAAPDHPMHPMLPESSYLKGFLIQLD